MVAKTIKRKKKEIAKEKLLKLLRESDTVEESDFDIKTSLINVNQSRK